MISLSYPHSLRYLVPSKSDPQHTKSSVGFSIISLSAVGEPYAGTSTVTEKTMSSRIRGLMKVVWTVRWIFSGRSRGWKAFHNSSLPGLSRSGARMIGRTFAVCPFLHLAMFEFTIGSSWNQLGCPYQNSRPFANFLAFSSISLTVSDRFNSWLAI